MTAELLPYLRDLYGHVTAYHGRGKTFNRGPLTDELLRGHLEGRLRVGTYFDPGDGTVKLGVIDLDNEENPDGEKPHAKRAAEGLADLGLSAEIFTSKGKGYHVPVYFAEPVPAWAVRKVLKYAATKAGRPGAEIFPKQDKVDVYIPPIGSEESARVGNFINLPFNGADLPRGRTALLSKGNGLDPYPDQAEGAKGIKKSSAEDLAAALEMIGEDLTPPARKPAGPVGEKLTEGQRRPTLFSFAGSMRDRGATPEEILPALQAMNSNRCEPQLPEKELRKLAKGTEKFTPKHSVTVATMEDTPGEDVPLILDPAAPLDCARAYLDRKHTLNGERTLLHQNEEFFEYTPRGDYRNAPAGEIRCELWGFLDGALQRKKMEKAEIIVPFKPNKVRIGDVFDALRAAANVPASLEPPAFLDDPRRDAGNYLALGNGILNVETRELIPHTPRFFNLGAAGYDYDPVATSPTWERFQSDLFDDDLESRDTLEEILGLFLVRETKYQKIPLVVGPRRAGKGVLGRLVPKVIGKRRVATPTITSLGESFGLQQLVGKSVAVIGDVRLRADAEEVAERLLAISGEDGISIQRKFKESLDGGLPIRFLLLSNEIPYLNDPSGALSSRFIILQLTESFLGKEDPDLEANLERELPGILNRCLDGLQRLRDRGRFLQPAKGTAAIEALEALASPHKVFLEEMCEWKIGAEVGCDALYSAWRRWCEVNGRDHAGTKQRFARDLRTAFPVLGKPVRRGTDERIRVYLGVRLR